MNMKTDMNILAVDTTAKTAAVCVASGDADTGLAPKANFAVNGTLTHSESLLPMIDEALRRAGVSLRELSAIAVTAGPGSFTGVRIGVSTVKGLSFALDDKIPCIPLSTLYCLALGAAAYGENTILCPVMDARREQFYNALFRLRGGKPRRLCDDRAVSAEELTQELLTGFAGKKIVLCGDGARLYRRLLNRLLDRKLGSTASAASAKILLARPEHLEMNAFSAAFAAYETLTLPNFVFDERYAGASLAPFYLRQSQAERTRNERESGNGSENEKKS